MFQRISKGNEIAEYLERIEAWTRRRFGLDEKMIVLVSQDPGRKPGYPPLETNVVFWTDRATRYRFRIFKPAREVTEEDVPVAWLLPTLLDDGEADCC